MILIQGCKNNDRESQRLLYKHYYAYAMSICLRYANSDEEAAEILNDGFMKVFSKINLYDTEKPFKGWLRTIMIHTAIDHFRSNKKHYYHADLDDSLQERTKGSNVLDDMSYEELLRLTHRLTPVYRTVFSMYVIDGYSHDDIAKKLSISVGTSKSNLSKARARLRQMLKEQNEEVYERYL